MRFDLTFAKTAPTPHPSPLPGSRGSAAYAMPKKTLKQGNQKVSDDREDLSVRKPYLKINE